MGHKTAFLSYNRKDSLAFTARLYQYLEDKGYGVWFDYVNIESGENFLIHIQNGIRDAQNFVFIMSPDSVDSPYCMDELRFAIAHGKRVIPITHIALRGNQYDLLPKEAQLADWIPAKQEQHAELNRMLKPRIDNLGVGAEEVRQLIEQSREHDIDELEVSFDELTRVFDKEADFTHYHSRLLAQAHKWEQSHKSTQFLLVGKEKELAQDRLRQAAGRKFPPFFTDLQAEYICESRKNGEGMLTDVFITYSRKDTELVDRFDRALQKHLVTTWLDRRDIEKGREYDEEIQHGIENADSFIFLISPDAVRSAWCMKELAYAQELQKRVIPVLLRPTGDDALPEALSKSQYEDLSRDVAKVSSILGILGNETGYYYQHKTLLVQALKWKRQNYNVAILLRGNQLEKALQWLTASESRKRHNPTAVQKQFIAESEARKGQLSSEVFISYSRTDGDFARELNNRLQLNGHTTWFDQESIPAGASDFWEQIQRGIRASNNFVFIISPESILSEYCKQEVDFAQGNGKRIITLNYRTASSERLKEVGLAQINWIDFENKADLGQPFGELSRSLAVDRAYIEQHTFWGLKALEWEEHHRDKGGLLMGAQLDQALAWLREANDAKKQPAPTDVQRQLIAESRREHLVAIAAERRTKRRLQLLLVLSVAAAVVALLLGWFAFNKYLEADEALATANRQTEIANAEKERNKGLFEEANRQKEAADKRKKEAEREKAAADVARDLAKKKETLAQSLLRGTTSILKSFLPAKEQNIYSFFKKHADSLFNEGKYHEAFQNYNMANNAPDKRADGLGERMKLCEQLFRTRELADRNFEQMNYKEAEKYYLKLKAFEKENAYAQRQLAVINPLYDMVYIQGGTFNRICTDDTDQDTLSEDTDFFTISLSSFSIGRCEVTVAQYAKFLNEYGSLKVKEGQYKGKDLIEVNSCKILKKDGRWVAWEDYENYPMCEVSWYGAQEFCKHYGLLLPTEFQWEYAACGGTLLLNEDLLQPIPYPISNRASYKGFREKLEKHAAFAWYRNNSQGKVQPVGRLQPNVLGVHDMSGNVWEWCYNEDWDWERDCIKGELKNPVGIRSSYYGMDKRRIFRGGSYDVDLSRWFIRLRLSLQANRSRYNLGFRVCFEP